MLPEFKTLYSQSEEGYYCKFYDAITGRTLILPSGKPLETATHKRRYRAHKMAKRILRQLYDKESPLAHRVRSGLFE